MLRTLRELATFFSGLPINAYTDVETKLSKSAYLIRGNDLNQNGFVSTESLQQVYLVDPEKYDRFKLEKGDVAVLARGSAFRVGLITEEIASLGVIASANFIIIRPIKTEILGEVITAFFNTENGRRFLLKHVIDSSIPQIPSTNLKNMEIPVPNIDVQNKICEIFYASHAVYQATLELAEQRKKTTNTFIYNLMQEK